MSAEGLVAIEFFCPWARKALAMEFGVLLGVLLAIECRRAVKLLGQWARNCLLVLSPKMDFAVFECPVGRQKGFLAASLGSMRTWRSHPQMTISMSPSCLFCIECFAAVIPFCEWAREVLGLARSGMSGSVSFGTSVLTECLIAVELLCYRAGIPNKAMFEICMGFCTRT
jgi:hypothetical protein